MLAPELAQLARIPAAAEHVWSWFCNLSPTRRMGYAAAEPLSWSDIEAYFRLLGVAPLRWEVAALRRLDETYLASRAPDRPAAAGAIGGAKALKRRMTGRAAL